MGKVIDFKALLDSKFWQPEDDKDLLVQFGDWDERIHTFSKEEGEKKVFVLKVLQVGDDVFAKPKEFSTTARSFIQGIRPMIERANAEEKNTVTVVMKRTKGKDYTVIDAANFSKKTA